ncbi:MAG: FHA domain-containing protein [Caldilineaceae bacterium]
MENKLFRGKSTYEVLTQDRLGENSAYTFYLVKARESGQRFTLVTSNEYVSPAQNKRILQRAARIMGMVESAHILKAHDVGQDGERVFVVLEDIQGNPLPQWFAGKQRVDEFTALRLMRQFALALQEFEYHKVAHGYLKPGSAYIFPDPSSQSGELLKIWDLVLANSDKATIPYQAPETLDADGQAEIRDIRADIYSVGAITYWLLTGRPPYETANSGSLVRQILGKEYRPTPLDGIRSDLSKACVELIDRCLQKEPLHRFNTARELVATIDKVLGNQQNADEYLFHQAQQAEARQDWEEILRLAKKAEAYPGATRRLRSLLQRAEKMLEETAERTFAQAESELQNLLAQNRLAEATARLTQTRKFLSENLHLSAKQKNQMTTRLRTLEEQIATVQKFKHAWLESESTKQKYPLDTRRISVGRSAQSQEGQLTFLNLVAEPRAATVSRQEHAVLSFEEGVWRVNHNATSANRTYVNDKMVAPNQPVALKHNDVVKFGLVELRFALQDNEAA